MIRTNLKQDKNIRYGIPKRKFNIKHRDWFGLFSAIIILIQVPATIVVVWLICMELGLPWDRALFVGGLCGYLRLA